MGSFITANGGKIAYGVKSFVIDTFKDIYDLPYCQPGSIAYCIETGQQFILDTLHRWNLYENSGTKGLWIGTEEEFNNLESYDKDTFYIITELNGSGEDQDDQEEEEEDVFWIELTLDETDGTFTANKTYGEIVIALNNNKLPVFRLTNVDSVQLFHLYDIKLEEKIISFEDTNEHLRSNACESDNDYPVWQL